MLVCRFHHADVGGGVLHSFRGCGLGGGNLGCSTDVVHKGSANKVYKVCLLRGAVGGWGRVTGV